MSIMPTKTAVLVIDAGHHPIHEENEEYYKIFQDSNWANVRSTIVEHRRAWT